MRRVPKERVQFQVDNFQPAAFPPDDHDVEEENQEPVEQRALILVPCEAVQWQRDKIQSCDSTLPYGTYPKGYFLQEHVIQEQQ